MAQKTTGVCLELPLFCKGREFPLPEGEECCSKHFSKLMGFAFKSFLIKPALQLLILWSQCLTVSCASSFPPPSQCLIPWPSLSASPPAQTCSPLATPRLPSWAFICTHLAQSQPTCIAVSENWQEVKQVDLL